MRFSVIRSLLLIVAFGLAASVSGVQAQQDADGPDTAEDGPPTCDGYVATKWLTTPGTLNGTNGDDVLVGSSGDDVLNGLGGDDVICGSTLDACFVGNSNADVLNGGSGDDVLSDACGITNQAHGGTGSDYIVVTGTAYGGSGNDWLVTLPSFGTVWSSGFLADGGSGNDSLYGISDAALVGDSGNDWIATDEGAPTIDCGSGNDTVFPGGATSVRRCEKVN